MVIRKIKEWIKKPFFQWLVVSVFFTTVVLIGLYLFIQETETHDNKTVEEVREENLQNEIDHVLENRK